jgi:Domain of unknown function (DUF397)
MTDGERWRTSTYSGGQGGNCVEVGQAAGVVLVRDTKDDGRGPVHRFTVTQWRAFAAAVRDRKFGPEGSGRLP